MINRAIAVLCAAVLFTMPLNQAFAAGQPGPGAILVDAAVVRPATLAVTVVGAALFVVTLPFSAASKSVKQTGRALVGKPYQATFERPLGDFDALEQASMGPDAGTPRPAPDSK